MLSRSNRLTASRGFAEAVRRGRRAGTSTVVLHLQPGPRNGPAGGPRVGFVVSKAVGNAVTRNLVKRRLRHLARERLSSLPGCCVLVVRALPAAGSASFPALESDFDAALASVLRRVRQS